MSLRAVCGPSCPRCVGSSAHSARTMKALSSMVRLRHALCSSASMVGSSAGSGVQIVTPVRGMALRARAKQSKAPEVEIPGKNNDATPAEKVRSGTTTP